MDYAAKQTKALAASKKAGSFFSRKNELPFFSSLIQPKLTIGPVDDPYEREADAVAEKVMRLSDAETLQTQPATIQRKCAGCEEEDKVQMKGEGNTAGGSVVPPSVQHAITSSGHPLDTSTRSFMEERFGHDFEGVRIHNDRLAHQSAADINARAYTHGAHIVFGQAQYEPNKTTGKHLLAHELAHVVQQNGNKNNLVKRKPFFKDCDKDLNYIPGGNKEMELTLDRAKDFIDVAISILRWDFTRYKNTSTYHTAITRHFINPNDTERESIRSNFIKMREKLKPGNIRCVSSDTDIDICYSQEGKLMMAFFRDDAIWLCPSFWMQSRNCRAITLVHEAAHAIGLGLGTHPPYRGAPVYPHGAEAPSAGQSASIRIGNPESYAYFGAHIWREIDSQCIGLGEVMIIKSKAPDEPAKTK